MDQTLIFKLIGRVPCTVLLALCALFGLPFPEDLCGDQLPPED